jgi:hypothetical protein
MFNILKRLIHMHFKSCKTNAMLTLITWPALLISHAALSAELTEAQAQQQKQVGFKLDDSIQTSLPSTGSPTVAEIARNSGSKTMQNTKKNSVEDQTVAQEAKIITSSPEN